MIDAALVDRLARISREQFSAPFDPLAWPEALGREGWCTLPELVSLHGTPAWDALDESQRRRLAFLEAVNFMSLNIHGEKPLVEGLARRLYAPGNDVLSPYLHHFLDEENKHMVYFGAYCLKYAGKIYPDRKLAFPREFAPGEEDFLFFAKVLIFEEIVDVYNLRMSVDARMEPVTRSIHLLHHRDEARHLVFGRELVRALFHRHAPAWSVETLAGVRGYLGDYLQATWQEYYNPDVYRDLGLPEPRRVQAEAMAHPAARAHRQEVSSRCVAYLLENGMLESAPAW